MVKDETMSLLARVIANKTRALVSYEKLLAQLPHAKLKAAMAGIIENEQQHLEMLRSILGAVAGKQETSGRSGDAALPVAPVVPGGLAREPAGAGRGEGQAEAPPVTDEARAAGDGPGTQADPPLAGVVPPGDADVAAADADAAAENDAAAGDVLTMGYALADHDAPAAWNGAGMGKDTPIAKEGGPAEDRIPVVEAYALEGETPADDEGLVGLDGAVPTGAPPGDDLPDGGDEARERAPQADNDERGVADTPGATGEPAAGKDSPPGKPGPLVWKAF